MLRAVLFVVLSAVVFISSASALYLYSDLQVTKQKISKELAVENLRLKQKATQENRARILAEKNLALINQWLEKERKALDKAKKKITSLNQQLKDEADTQEELRDQLRASHEKLDEIIAIKKGTGTDSLKNEQIVTSLKKDVASEKEKLREKDIAYKTLNSDMQKTLKALEVMRSVQLGIEKSLEKERKKNATLQRKLKLALNSRKGSPNTRAAKAHQQFEQTLSQQRLSAQIDKKDDTQKPQLASVSRTLGEQAIDTEEELRKKRQEQKELTKRVTVIQRELQRLGCYPGFIDGLWGEVSRFSLETFSSHANLTTVLRKPTRRAVEVLKSHSDRVCPAGTHRLIIKKFTKKQQ